MQNCRRTALRGFRPILAGLALSFGAMTLWSASMPCPPAPAAVPTGDHYAPALGSIDNLDKAEAWIRSRPGMANASQARTARTIDQFMRNRFFHELSTFRVCDDWLATMAAALRPEVGAPVRPDDLLKYDRALCSQQTLLFQALLQRFGIDFATVTINFPPHMMPAARIDGVWTVLDSDIEPNNDRLHSFEALQNPRLWREIYRGKTPLAGFGPGDLGEQWQRNAVPGTVTLTGVNQNPAARGAVFHGFTHVMSRFGWLVFALGFLGSYAKVPAIRPRPVPIRTGIGWGSLVTSFARPLAYGRRALGF